MKNLALVFIVSISFFACSNSTSNQGEGSETQEYFGEQITIDDAIEASEFFSSFGEDDSIPLKVTGTINEVCKKKGCWMTMSIGEDEEMMVRFKDYGFFVPLNADGRLATIEGWAFKEELSVEALKHYAFDAGETDEEIAKITEPEITYSFIANGVIIE